MTLLKYVRKVKLTNSGTFFISGPIIWEWVPKNYQKIPENYQKITRTVTWVCVTFWVRMQVKKNLGIFWELIPK